MMGRPHDPGEVPAPAGDPLVSQVIYALRDLRVEGPAMAEGVLAAANVRLWLSPAQREAVLDGMRPPLIGPDHPMYDEEDPPGVSWSGLAPVGPAYIPPSQRHSHAEDD